ncbi:hypothetical protein CICLE_v10027217mg [Citrus x clementina]|uniref:Uncharacterized protein n=1 Tax=Citrus clementina TaxID=85681 RepID=V4S0R9_CITCL|nr:hypothetical protein CICLE_v10027217mg [Citrus x clementina]
MSTITVSPPKNIVELFEFNSLDMIQDAGAQKYLIANFLEFKMIEDKEVTSQIHGFHMLINDSKNENINLPEFFVHKNLEDAIVQIRVEEKHRQMDQLEKAKEITSKANLIENEAHLSKNQNPNNNKLFKNKKITFKKKGQLLCLWQTWIFCYQMQV